MMKRYVRLIESHRCKISKHQKMGRQRRVRAHKARKETSKKFRLKRKTKDLDQIEKDLADPQIYASLKAQEVDADLPGLAQHYCVECTRYFINDDALQTHTKSKVHKRRYIYQTKFEHVANSFAV